MSSDKTEQPTAKKKREARRDGNLARSPEVVAWAQMLAAGVLLPASFSRGTHSLHQVMTQVAAAITRPDADASVRLLGSALTGGLLAIAPLALGMVAIGLVGNFAQTGFAISGKALKPKFAVPMHYGFYPGVGVAADGERFKKAAAPIEVKVFKPVHPFANP